VADLLEELARQIDEADAANGNGDGIGDAQPRRKDNGTRF
jgi:hypothetical protein